SDAAAVDDLPRAGAEWKCVVAVHTEPVRGCVGAALERVRALRGVGALRFLARRRRVGGHVERRLGAVVHEQRAERMELRLLAATLVVVAVPHPRAQCVYAVAWLRPGPH